MENAIKTGVCIKLRESAVTVLIEYAVPKKNNEPSETTPQIKKLAV